MDLLRLLGFPKAEDYSCAVCGSVSSLISRGLGVCKKCIMENTEGAIEEVESRRKKLRSKFDLPVTIPRSKTDGNPFVKCTGCVNACEISEGGSGFCGLRANPAGRLEVLAGTPRGALVEWYYDPLPTNCVADFVCPGGTGCGYPKYSHSKNKPEHGHSNLAVFYRACTFDCMFCQNWHFRKADPKKSELFDSKYLAEAAQSNKTSCICYFGGDPTPQLTHSLKAGRLARELAGAESIMRICWESNGSMPASLARSMGELALESGGCIKFDLKVRDENLHSALCGTSNKNTFSNFKMLYERFFEQRREPPVLVASTLMVPGYVEVEEVIEIAEFIAELDQSIPYSLLGFHPDFNMMDQGTTSRKTAEACKSAAEEAGLENVRIGNLHLLQ